MSEEMERKTINLTIEDFEHKVSRDGKTNYTRFKTQEGWISCFDKTLIEDVVKSTGKTLECEVSVDDKDRKILQKVIGAGQSQTLPETPNAPTTPTPTGKATAMYVSYAKDIFIALTENEGPLTEEALMNVAINLIKQAEKAFI